MEITFSTYTFDELTTRQLYDICVLRQAVFIVEQDCPYLDADGKDLESYHVLGIDGKGTLHAYTRLVPEGVSYKGYTSIGRVVNSAAVRGTGTGRKLMEYSIQATKSFWPSLPIKISAQSYLLRFYSSLGFEAVGEEYLEDNILHTAMVCLKETKNNDKSFS